MTYKVANIIWKSISLDNGQSTVTTFSLHKSEDHDIYINLYTAGVNTTVMPFLDHFRFRLVTWLS